MNKENESIADILGGAVRGLKKEYCKNCEVRLSKDAVEYRSGRYCKRCAAKRQNKK